MTATLTGIQPTGDLHLGNYAGAVRPLAELANDPARDVYLFVADLHALNGRPDPAVLRERSKKLVAALLACGLDRPNVHLYRQSRVPAVAGMASLLSNVASKGLLNRAHAYKAAVDRNLETGEDADAGVTAGLYLYPVLMAADILAFDANQVPVGRDQIQHIEMARDLAQRFNHLHDHEFFVLPEALIEEQVATLPGLDGRKMSKSYDNTIPLFAGGSKALRAAIMRIVTDSRLPGEPKDPDDCALFTIYRAFADTAETAAFRQALLDGISWGDAKQALYERVEADVAPMRERYAAFMADPPAIEAILQQGAHKARAIATPKIAALRAVLGLNAFHAATVPSGRRQPQAVRPGKLPRFASFRDTDGSFRFRLLSTQGEELLLSMAFAEPKAAGALQQRLKTLGATAAVWQRRPLAVALELDGQVVACTPEYANAAARDDASRRLREALDQLAARA